MYIPALSKPKGGRPPASMSNVHAKPVTCRVMLGRSLQKEHVPERLWRPLRIRSSLKLLGSAPCALTSRASLLHISHTSHTLTQQLSKNANRKPVTLKSAAPVTIRNKPEDPSNQRVRKRELSKVMENPEEQTDRHSNTRRQSGSTDDRYQNKRLCDVPESQRDTSRNATASEPERLATTKAARETSRGRGGKRAEPPILGKTRVSKARPKKQRAQVLPPTSECDPTTGSNIIRDRNVPRRSTEALREPYKTRSGRLSKPPSR